MNGYDEKTGLITVKPVSKRHPLALEWEQILDDLNIPALTYNNKRKGHNGKRHQRHHQARKD